MAATAPAAITAEAGAAALRAYFSTHPAVWLWEGGERRAQLGGEDSGYAVASETGRLVCHFWSAEANLVRQVIGWRTAADRLQLECRRMGRSRPTRLTLAPVNAEGAALESTAAARAQFRQALVAAAQRTWPQWRQTVLEGGNGHPVVRLLLRRQHALVVVAAVGEQDAEAADAVLVQALLAAAQARARYPGHYLTALRLILPEGSEALTATRRRWLKAEVPIEAWRLDRSAGQLDARAWESEGNSSQGLRRALDPAPALTPAAATLLETMREICPQMVCTASGRGGFSFQLYGLEVARSADGSEALSAPFVFGCGLEQTPLTAATQPLFHSFLHELARTRVADGDARSPWYRLQPERWMEQLLRHDLRALDAHLDPRWVYSQVPACHARERDVLDLLACDGEGRLLVIELKAGEDLAFPLQALDYWARVRQHQLAGDFERLGYFPGSTLSPLPPRLWLVAPALRWHPHTEALTAWLAPEIPWTRIGLNETWRHGIQVVYRKEAPHERS